MGLMQYRRRTLNNAPHLETASGAIATFNTDIAAPLKECKISFFPVQDSSGDPSPDNVRPISGWDAVGVWRNGSNLIGFDDREQYAGGDFRPNNVVDFSKPYVYYGIASSGYRFANNVPSDVVISSDNCITFTPQYDWYGIGFNIPIKGGVTYSTIANVVSGYAIGVAFYDSDSKFISTTNARTFTAPSNAVNAIVVFSARVAEGTVSVENARIVYGNNTSAEYELYSGINIEIDLGQTVYGGHLDVLTGELTVDMAMVDLGTLNWLDTPTDTSGIYRCFTDDLTEVAKQFANSVVANAVCSHYKTESADGTYLRKEGISIARTGRLNIYDPRYDQIDDIPILIGTLDGIMLCYELAEPITYQLTPQQIKSIAGQNNIYADANGEVTVTYWTH